MADATNPKKTAILQAATRIFLAQGYSGASMDAIAEAAPVSKATLYSHFRNKQELFAAVIAAKCQGLFEALQDQPAPGMGAEQILSHIATVFVELIYAEESLAMYRLVVAETRNFPELGQLVGQGAVEPVSRQLAAHLAELGEQGALRLDDPAVAARLFLSLLEGHEHSRCLLGLQAPPDAAERKRLVETAVGFFIRGHRAG